MKQYKIDNGTITLKLIPNYEIADTNVTTLVRSIQTPNYDETLMTYYDPNSDLLGLSYVKTYKDNTKIIFNIKSDKSISYEYQYLAYDQGYYTIFGSYEGNGNRGVIIKKDNEERIFRKFIDKDGIINYIYSDNKEKDTESYQLLIHYNPKENETIYSLYGGKRYFEYSETKEEDCLIEDFFNDNNLVLTYDGERVYKGKYQEKEIIDPDKELESIIKGEIEIEEEEEIEYEEIELDSKYYKNNGHGPIYNKEVSKYIENVEFYLDGLKSSFPKIKNIIFSKDKEYTESIKESYPDVDFNKLLPNINPNNFIDSALNNIKVRRREK